MAPLTGEAIDYPCVYFAHVFATEVYFVVRYHVDAYITIGFGQSPVPGLPGAGVWLTGNATNSGTTIYCPTWSTDHYVDSYFPWAGMFTTRVGYNGGQLPGQVHHGLDGKDWSISVAGGWGSSGNATGIDAGANATLGAYRLIDLCSPNAWNGETLLAPIQPVTSRGSSMVSMIADLANARYASVSGRVAFNHSNTRRLDNAHLNWRTNSSRWFCTTR